MTKIAIVIGSTRPGRKAEAVARWVHDHARQRDDATFELVDLADYNLPLLDEPVPPIMGDYAHAHTHAWSQSIAAYDAYVFVTPEYNHSTSGVLKNAIDFLFAEWSNKACAFVSYGVQGGTRGAEHLRLVAAELKLADVRGHVALTLGADVRDGTVDPNGVHLEAMDDMLDDLVAWGGALAPLRAARADDSGARPALSADDGAVEEATRAVARFVQELQVGIDEHDADVYNRHFAADVMWGSPFGETVRGYEELHAIHVRLNRQATGGPSSRYEIDQVLVPAPDVAIAHVRRVALGPDGQAIDPTFDVAGAFSEMALYVLLRRGGTWWLAAGQNTPLRPPPPTDPA